VSLPVRQGWRNAGVPRARESHPCQVPIRNERTLPEAALEDSDTSPTSTTWRPAPDGLSNLRSITTGHRLQVPRKSHICATPRWTPESRALIQWSGSASQLVDEVALRRVCWHRGDVCGSQRF
jgi:hypothetical protein